MDTAKIADAAFEMIEEISEGYPDAAEIADVVVIVEIDLDPSKPKADLGDDEAAGSIDWRGTSKRMSVVLGLVEYVRGRLNSGDYSDRRDVGD